MTVTSHLVTFIEPPPISLTHVERLCRRLPVGRSSMKDLSSINNYFKSAIKLISAINLAVLNMFLVTSSYTVNGADEWP